MTFDSKVKFLILKLQFVFMACNVNILKMVHIWGTDCLWYVYNKTGFCLLV